MKYERLTNSSLAKSLNDIEYKNIGDKFYIRLAELEDKIEAGTLIELPCKVGDILYESTGYEIREWEVISFNIEKEITINVRNLGFVANVAIKNFDKYFCKTKSEAEARLKELRGEL